MSVSQEPRAALVSTEDQGIIMALIDLNQETMSSEATTEAFIHAQDVMIRITQYLQPVRTIQAVCDHPEIIIALQKQITDLQMQQLLPPFCYYTTFDQQIQQLTNDLNDAWKTSRTVRMDDDLQRELDDMTLDAREAREESRNLRTQLTNGLFLAARAVPPAASNARTEVRKFPTPRTFQNRIAVS